MAIKYFVHVACGHQHSSRRAAIRGRLQTMGLRALAVLGDGIVYVSEADDVLRFANGDLVLGELFSRDGTRITDATRLLGAASSKAALEFVLTACWGDYVLLQQVPGDDYAITLMRSPSPASALQCVYSLGEAEGFITSDITLAIRLGLYERRVDPAGIVRSLAYPNLKSSSTGLLNVSELPPGSVLRASREEHRVTCVWSPWDFVGGDQRCSNFKDAALLVRQSIDMVVRAYAGRHKNVLLELSGGLDSSIVGISLAKTSARVACQSLITPLPGTDETDYAQSVADMLGAPLSVLELGYDEAPFNYPVPREFCGPCIGMLQFAVNRVMGRTAQACGCDAYFSGAGGDSVFCFLSTASPAADALRSAGLGEGLRTVRDLAEFHQCTVWKAGRLAIRRLLVERPPVSAKTDFLKKGVEVRDPEAHPWNIGPNAALVGDRERIAELASTQLFREGCARGLVRPLRMPLLAQPVVEACLRVPSWMWFREGQNRAVARQAFADRLPGNVLNRKSKGTFTAYLGAIYRRRSPDMLRFLTEGFLQAQGILDADALRALATTSEPASEATFMRVFHLCAVENWVQQQSCSKQS
ncbi:asparagine synthase C-terminal domain-containing protein [Pseudoxanthomonas winnipegensis]|uniref:asparagine synthase (glutamine-hydrolyzing) n=1 Tax=Pseudoxanthomonas winnipegensis TaxID=2480810 RepID=A0A4Q9TGT4_9GAMM|nr:asparagine synthase C-terminal domain-containing protein [Pseudoxanthomonas winnipegensis]RZZ81611.1 asparagine synthase [Pseudoxanthomonas winnipegensis]TAA24724.1 asparagine synthase [Pseudoxanthomonas winnipegensis]TAA39976.1 asparagine synthase [Pseudoxanthomonas winnipegensis]TBV74603.1 asparagine synthase [Pseudoxanthomonas winnipegensis]TBV75457.1 asparagine synthase [Pseudoxanthomonas winnipegensis]